METRINASPSLIPKKPTPTIEAMCAEFIAEAPAPTPKAKAKADAKAAMKTGAKAETKPNSAPAKKNRS